MTDPATSGEGYAGQVGLASDVTDYTVLDYLIWRQLGRVRTIVPVKVMAVTIPAGEGGAPGAVGFVDAQPLVKQMDGGGGTYAHGTIYNLPYVRTQGGANAVVCDPAVGDIGVALICDRDISSAKANKGIANPGSRRRFSLADGVYLPGTLNGAPTQWLRFAAAGIDLVDANGNSIVTAAGGITLTPKSGEPATVGGPLVVTGSGTVDGGLEVKGAATFDDGIAVTGNAQISGSIEVDGTVPLKRFLTGSATFTGAIGGNAFGSFTIAVAGAKVGDFVVLSFPAKGAPTLTYDAWVSAAGVVTVGIVNVATITVTAASVTYTVLVIGTI